MESAPTLLDAVQKEGAKISAAPKSISITTVMLWQHPKNYVLTLKDSNITDAKELSERN